MRTEAARFVLLLSLPFLSGCYSFCDGQDMLVRAKAGQYKAIRETGELADPLIPSSKKPPPRLREAYDALLPHLSSDDPFMRLSALESMRRLSTRSPSTFRDYYRDAFDPLLSDDDPQIRWRAAWALGRLRLSSSALRAAALDAEDRVAERAVWALGEARDEDSKPQLLAALDRPAVQKQAIRALKRVTGLQLGDDPEAWKRSAEKAGVAPPSDD
jgi:HEAT repeat protein